MFTKFGCTSTSFHLNYPISSCWKRLKNVYELFRKSEYVSLPATRKSDLWLTNRASYAERSLFVFCCADAARSKLLAGPLVVNLLPIDHAQWSTSSFIDHTRELHTLLTIVRKQNFLRLPLVLKRIEVKTNVWNVSSRIMMIEQVCHQWSRIIGSDSY